MNPPGIPARPPTTITANGRQFQNNGRPAPPPAAEPSRGVQQPTPQALPQRTGSSNIKVSTRQKENPLLKEIRAVAWEYDDIAADYVLGLTTCALFLSLKYHRLHPEYIYGRIRALQGRYNLRIILTLVDVTNHEESIKELSKTSMINNVTVILCWSFAEAALYLERFKIYENAPPTIIKAPPTQSHGDKLTEFITVPRGVNKTDALSLVSNFGSVRTAVNAKPEEILLLDGWGQKKVKQWHNAVTEPFRTRHAVKRGLAMNDELVPGSQRFGADVQFRDGLGGGVTTVTAGALTTPAPAPAARPSKRAAEEEPMYDADADEEEAILQAAMEQSLAKPDQPVALPKPPVSKTAEPEVSDGVLAALARLREQG
jgi:DNA excision repair protein ERCC-1